MEDDDLRAGGRRDPGGVVEHRRPPSSSFLPRSAWPMNASERRVHREDDVACARQLAEPLGPRVVQPEAALEVDLAGGVAALDEQLDRRPPGAPATGTRAGPKRGSLPSADAYRTESAMSSDRGPTLFDMAKHPSRIDLLELDIDLRLADLWREAGEVARVEPRGRGGVHARRLRQGLLRRAHRGRRPARSATTTATASRRARRADARLPRLRAVKRDATIRAVGPEAQSGAARHRALGRGGARGLPALHVDRGRRHAVARAERAGGHRQGVVSLGRSSAARLQGRRATAAGCASGCATSRAAAEPWRSSTRARSPTSSAPAATSRSRASCGTASSSPCKDSLVTKCPSKYTRQEGHVDA